MKSGVDVHDFGTLLKSAWIADIQDAVHTIVTLTAPQLEQSRSEWEFARAHHTRGSYAQVDRRAIEAIPASPHPVPKVRRKPV